MTQSDLEIIREVKRILTLVSKGQKVFLNLTQYKNLGLIETTNKHGIDATGNDIIIGTNFRLTEKARRILAVQL